MKKKIIIGLGAYTAALLLTGLYILYVINDSTKVLDNLVMLHQVEILREHYLLQIRRVQNNLALAGTRHSPDFDTFVTHTRNMARVVDTCFECHHAPPVMERLQDLKVHTQAFEESVSRVLTIRANAARLVQVQDASYHIGEQLVDKVSEMIAMTGARLETATQKSLREIDKTRYVLYTLVAVGPLLSAILGFVFISGLTNPLGALLQSTRKLKGGDLDHRVVGLRDEFGELADAFNEMAAALKDQMQKIHRAEQLAVAGELAAGLAHEIKNPLAGIKVAMHVLTEEATLSDEDRDVLRKVSHEVTRLETLMKSFLDFARPPKPQPVELNVNSLLNTTLAFYGKTRAAESRGANGITIVKELGEVPPTMADPMQLQQVFLNLLINAMDAMPQGGTLSVRTAFETEDDRIRIDIADTGKGIGRDDADKIFQPFFTTKHGGTGLGLAVSRQLVEQHGGTLTTRDNTGGGAVFTIRLPLQPVREGAVA